MIDFVDLDKWWLTHTRSCSILDWSVGLFYHEGDAVLFPEFSVLSGTPVFW